MARLVQLAEQTWLDARTKSNQHDLDDSLSDHPRYL